MCTGQTRTCSKPDFKKAVERGMVTITIESSATGTEHALLRMMTSLLQGSTVKTTIGFIR